MAVAVSGRAEGTAVPSPLITASLRWPRKAEAMAVAASRSSSGDRSWLAKVLVKRLVCIEDLGCRPRSC